VSAPIERTTLDYDLLVRALYGVLEQHRDGYFTVDGLRAEPALADTALRLIAEGLIGLYRDDQGNCAVHLTMEGVAMLNYWNHAGLEDGAS